MRNVNKGVVAILPFNVYNASSVLVNADVVPTIERIMVNGEITNVTGSTIEQQQDATPANITGRYQAKVPTVDLNFNDQVQVQIQVTVDGVTLREDLTFIVTNTPDARPRIDTV